MSAFANIIEVTSTLCHENSVMLDGGDGLWVVV